MHNRDTWLLGLFLVTICAVFDIVTIGAINSHNAKKTEVYRMALKTTDPTRFNYIVDSHQGNVITNTRLKAVKEVKFPEMKTNTGGMAVKRTLYILTLDLPVLLMPSWAKDVDKKVRFLHEKGHGLRNWLLTILFFVVVLALTYYSDTHWFISPRPWTDSIAATIGITGSLLTTLRFSESYYCWTLQGIMSVILWGITAAQGDANGVLFVTYLLYLANDMIAFFDKNISWFHHKK